MKEQQSTNEVFYKEKVVYKALVELDSKLKEMNVAPFELRVVGGFALLLENIRLTDYTDIDYVGSDFNDKIKRIIDQIGIEYKLGRGWLNNDVMLSGSSLDDFEACTGELEFEYIETLQVISVYSLKKEHLLRMKLIAIDTSLSAMSFGGEFTRAKDFHDIKLLADKLGLTYNDIVEDYFDYLIEPDCLFLLRYYLNFGDISVFSDEDKIKEIINSKGKVRI